MLVEAKTIGAKLNHRRIRAGLSMDELARKMGFAGQSSIQRYLDENYDIELRPGLARRFDEAVSGNKSEGMMSDDRDWSKIAEPAKDAYWAARRAGKDESAALLDALKVAIAEAEKRAPHPHCP